LLQVRSRLQVKAAKVGTIETDTPIIPTVVADSVVSDWLDWLQEADHKVFRSCLPKSEKLAEYLASEAERLYKVNIRFAKKIRGAGNQGRDMLKSFMFHWMTSKMIKSFSQIKLNSVPRNLTGLSSGFLKVCMTRKQIVSSATIKALYHGTCENQAQMLLATGWSPSRHFKGGNAGQTKYLYLTSEYDDALWFAQEKGCNTVLKLTNVPIDYLIVDPEDGTGDTVEDELGHAPLPGKVALIKPLSRTYFSLPVK
jgi:hypothetical protein